MFKKLLFGILLSVAIAAGVYWFSYTKEISTPVSPGINAIPGNAAIIFESKQIKSSWKKLSQTNIMWEELLGTESFSKLNAQAKYIDSLLISNVEVSKLLDNHSVFVSAHLSGANTYDFLVVYSLPNLTYTSILEDFFKTINKNTAPSPRDYDGASISTIHPPGKDSLSYAFLNGIVMMSCKQNLVEDAIRQLKSGASIANDRNFSKVINTAGKNVDGNVYVNYKTFPKLLNNFIFPTLQSETNGLADFADYSGWDITLKPNALMLNGFTQANDSSILFLNLFRKQKPQEIELTKIVPSKTALLLFFGISNIKTFQRDYKHYLSAKQRSQKYEQYVDGINKKYKINMERSMLDWINNEMALVVTEPSSTDFTNNSFAVFRSNNINDATKTLNEMVDSISKKEKPDTTNYRDHIISQLKLPNILSQLFGWQFNKITENYFTSIDDYIVFANTDAALRSFINDFENNKILANTKNYQAFSENISGEANLFLYSSISRSSNIYSYFVTEELSKEFEKQLKLFQKFEGISIQFTFNNKLFYSSIYLKYNPELKQEVSTLWETKLDTSISSKPYLVTNHITKAKEIFVQDDGNKIYLISNTGKIIWTKQLHEKIMSDVTQVDIFKNNKLQLLFNTRTGIYLMDRNGSDMKGFPVKLKAPATNALSVFDYEKNRDYRIFIASANKNISCYKINGEEVAGFKSDKTSNLVYLPIQYFRAENKDHVCAVDVKGKIYIFDRQGKTRFKIKESLATGIHNYYIETGKDYSKSYLVAADTLGNIIKISLTGDKENIRMQGFETAPYFDYKDLDNNKTKEYIFLTRNNLKVFSADKSVVFNYDFQSKTSGEPLFFVFPDSSEKTGVVSREENKLYLFNENGSLYQDFPLTGKTNFSIGDINNEGIMNLVTGSSDHSIYMYQLE